MKLKPLTLAAAVCALGWGIPAQAQEQSLLVLSQALPPRPASSPPSPSPQQDRRDCAQCPEMVPIEPGTYLMGAAPGEEEREGLPREYRGFSQPQLRVTIGYPFSLGKYEVTRGEFAAFVEATGHRTGSSCYVPQGDGKLEERHGVDWRNPGFAQTDRDPVACVSWDDAQAYVAWLRKVTGKTYRLPSEAEWEYAARAGSTGARYWGESRDDTCLNANVADLTAATQYNWQKTSENIFLCSDAYASTAPVGQFRPNAFGLHDMLGNVWEWTGDCWAKDLVGAPVDGSDRGTTAHSGDCSQRVARGGSSSIYPAFVRAAYRGRSTTGGRSYLVGFRVARTP